MPKPSTAQLAHTIAISGQSLLILIQRPGLSGLIDSLIACQHALESFRRSLPNRDKRARLDRKAEKSVRPPVHSFSFIGIHGSSIRGQIEDLSTNHPVASSLNRIEPPTWHSRSCHFRAVLSSGASSISDGQQSSGCIGVCNSTVVGAAVGIGSAVATVAIITPDRKVAAAAVIAGPQLLREAALDAVHQWVSKPFTVNGEPVDAFFCHPRLPSIGRT